MIGLLKDDIVYLQQEVLRKDLTNILRCTFKQQVMVASHTTKQLVTLDGFDESKLKNRRDFYERFIWRSIFNENGGEVLDVGDIFRMGRLRFRVREIHDEKGNRTILTKGLDSHVEYKEH